MGSIDRCGIASSETIAQGISGRNARGAASSSGGVPKWLRFENFIADMGQRPSNKHSIDRIDNNGDYEPTNCRWATKKEQCNNMRKNRVLVFNDEAKTIAQWSEVLGLSYDTIRCRLRRGATVEKALR